MKLMNFKTILLAGAVSAGVLLNSCTDLSEDIYSNLSTEKTDFSSEDIKAMIAPAYASLREVYWGWNGLFDIYEESSDLIMTPLRISIGWGDLYITLHKHTYHSYIDHFWTIWNNSYKGITTINSLLDLDTDVVDEYKPELRGLRALYYYILFDNFRNIPLETTTAHEKGYLPTQSTPAEVFKFIVDELEDVKEALGTDTSVTNYGHFNKFVACMILAKMYLNYNAWFDTDDNSWYEKAIDEVNIIISEGGYQLATNYTDPFKESGMGCPEIIYAIPFEYGYATGNYLSNKTLYAASAATFGLSGDPWGGNCAVPQFIDSYDPDDERLDMTWLMGPQYNQSGNPILVNGVQLDYTKEVTSIDNPGAYYNEGARFIKYEILSGSKGTYADDTPFFRLTDAYMIKAECLLRVGGYKGETEQDAADLVTRVRERAFRNNPAKAVRTVADLKGGSQYPYGYYENGTWETVEGGDDIILGGLLDDLAWEFVGEHHRRQDLIRFKKTNGINVYRGKSRFCKLANDDPAASYLDVFPIYQTFLDSNMNLNQNPGY